MTPSDEPIKQAILHPEPAFREYAVRFFDKTHSADDAVVPLVFQAAELYGRENALSLLRAAEDLPLTNEAIDWLMEELKDDQPAPSVILENVRFAMALLLCNPESELVAARGRAILALPGFPEVLKPSLREVIELAQWDWPTAWKNLLELGRQASRRPKLTTSDHRRLHRYVRSMGRFRDEGGEQVLEALSDRHRGPGRALVRWLKPWLIHLAGQMRLENAIPVLMEILHYSETEDGGCGEALGQIGTDAVVAAVCDRWPHARFDERAELAEALRPIRSERCLQACQTLLRRESDEALLDLLGDALLSQLDPRAIQAVRGLVKKVTRRHSSGLYDLKDELVIAATIVQSPFPEYDQWFQQAERDNFGREDYGDDFRMADNYQEQPLETATTPLLTKTALAELAADRASTEQILEAISHPNPQARRLAVNYFAQGFLPEPAVMPRLIQAVEQYGRESCRSQFRHGASLMQTEETLDWMIQELQQPLDVPDELMSYESALARILEMAPPELLAKRLTEIERISELDPETLERIKRRIVFSQTGPEALWNQLEAFCESEKDADYLDEVDLPLGYDLVEALARDEAFCAPRCLEALQVEIDHYEDNPLVWMEGLMVQMAGRLKLQEAVPFLVNWLHEDDDWLEPLAREALTRIGTDSVVEALVEDYPVGGWGYRFSTSILLGTIHSEASRMACWTVPEQESDPSINTQWASSLLGHFTSRGIDSARELILAEEDDPSLLDLREDVLAIADVFGTTFPEREQWKDDVKHNRGRHHYFTRRSQPADDELEDDEWEGDEDLEFHRPPEPSITIVNEKPKVGRNDPCPCGSGKKYKKCCLNNESGPRPPID